MLRALVLCFTPTAVKANTRLTPLRDKEAKAQNMVMVMAMESTVSRMAVFMKL